MQPNLKSFYRFWQPEQIDASVSMSDWLMELTAPLDESITGEALLAGAGRSVARSVASFGQTASDTAQLDELQAAFAKLGLVARSAAIEEPSVVAKVLPEQIVVFDAPSAAPLASTVADDATTEAGFAHAMPAERTAGWWESDAATADGAPSVLRGALKKVLWESVHTELATHFEQQEAIGVAVISDASVTLAQGAAAMADVSGTAVLDEPQTLMGRLRNRV